MADFNFYQTKSEENLQAAKFLINKQLFNSSIHCAYYACVQLLSFITLNNLKISKQDFDEGVEAKSSHLWLSQQFWNYFCTQNYDDACDFRDTFGAIRGNRKQADYKAKKFTKAEADAHLKEATDFINQLKIHFQI